MEKESTFPYDPSEDVRVRFSETRAVTNRVAARLLSQELPFTVTIRPISDQAAAVADGWHYDGARVEHRPGWSWTKEVVRYRRVARRIEAAFYAHDPQGMDLWGLLLGRSSNSRVVASIHFIERDPGNDRAVQFAAAALRNLELHAVATRCTVFGVNHPHPELVDYYREKGLTRELRRGSRLIRLESNVDPALADLLLTPGPTHDIQE